MPLLKSKTIENQSDDLINNKTNHLNRNNEIEKNFINDLESDSLHISNEVQKEIENISTAAFDQTENDVKEICETIF